LFKTPSEESTRLVFDLLKHFLQKFSTTTPTQLASVSIKLTIVGLKFISWDLSTRQTPGKVAITVRKDIGLFFSRLHLPLPTVLLSIIKSHKEFYSKFRTTNNSTKIFSTLFTSESPSTHFLSDLSQIHQKFEQALDKLQPKSQQPEEEKEINSNADTDTKTASRTDQLQIQLNKEESEEKKAGSKRKNSAIITTTATEEKEEQTEDFFIIDKLGNETIRREVFHPKRKKKKKEEKLQDTETVLNSRKISGGDKNKAGDRDEDGDGDGGDVDDSIICEDGNEDKQENVSETGMKHQVHDLIQSFKDLVEETEDKETEGQNDLTESVVVKKEKEDGENEDENENENEDEVILVSVKQETQTLRYERKETNKKKSIT